MFVMWLGEQISLFGIGNGSSMIIFAGIVARFPTMFAQLLTIHPAKSSPCAYTFYTYCWLHCVFGKR